MSFAIPHELLPKRCAKCLKIFQPQTIRQKYCLDPCKYKYRKPSAEAKRAIQAELDREVRCDRCGTPFKRHNRKVKRCSGCSSRPGYERPMTKLKAIEHQRLLDGPFVPLDRFYVKASDMQHLVKPNLPQHHLTEAALIAKLESLPDNDPSIPALQAQLEDLWKRTAHTNL